MIVASSLPRSPAAGPATHLAGQPLDTRVVALADAITVELEAGVARVGDRELRAPTQDKLGARMAAAIYDRYHAGRREVLPKNYRPLRDPELEEAFRAAMPHRTTLVPARLLSRGPDGAEVIVQGLGVRVRVRPEHVVTREGNEKGEGNAVQLRLPAARPAISPGFFLVDGSAGAPATTLRRVYLSLDEPRYEIWRRVLEFLENAGARYRAKVSSDRTQYPRRDAIVVYLDAEDEGGADARGTGLLDGLVATLHAAPELNESVSAFAMGLGRGIALAAEPAGPRKQTRRMSFGQHRSAAVTKGILAATRAGASGADRYLHVAEALREAGIDPTAVHRNLSPEPSTGPSADRGPGGREKRGHGHVTEEEDRAPRPHRGGTVPAQAEGTPTPTGHDGPPWSPSVLGYERLLLVASGGVTAAMLPYWLNWLRMNHPQVHLRVFITEGGARFVTRTAVAAILGDHGRVFADSWDDPGLGVSTGQSHMDLAAWAQAAVVYPAGANYLTRLALGAAGTPSLMTLQCLAGPIGVAPALPSGAPPNLAWSARLRELAERPNVAIAQPTAVRSLSTGEYDGVGCPPLPDVLRLIEERRANTSASGLPVRRREEGRTA